MDLMFGDGRKPNRWPGLVVIGRFADQEPSVHEKRYDELTEGVLQRTVKRKHFKGKAGQVCAVDLKTNGGTLHTNRVMLVGLGDQAKVDPRVLRDLGVKAAQEAYASHHNRLGVCLPSNASARDVAVGVRLGAYRFTTFTSADPDAPLPELDQVALFTPEPFTKAEGAQLEKADFLAGAVNYARQIVNLPPNHFRPRDFCRAASELSHDYPNMRVRTFDVEEMRQRGMNGILAVGSGSKNPPYLIHLSYRPSGELEGDAARPLVIVCKGLTFDSGGLSLKTAKGQEDMYIDMAGGAAGLAFMKYVGEVQPNIPVDVIIAAAENMPDGAAFRPSDIIKMYSGKTVEVLNTDAEGRLVLADALHYATLLDPKPRVIVDLATLTGACMVGLGNYYAGAFSPSEEFIVEILKAATASGEKIWHMPLDTDLAKQLKSKRGADLTNLGGPYGGAITAALFLKNFVGDCTWVHLDIAGPTLDDEGLATGFGVLTLCALLDQMDPPQAAAA